MKAKLEVSLILLVVVLFLSVLGCAVLSPPSIVGTWDSRTGIFGSQWTFSPNGTGHTTNFTGQFQFTWKIVGNQLDVTSGSKHHLIPFELKGDVLDLQLPDGIVTCTRLK